MDNKKETIFPEGMSFFQPHYQAPDYVKGDISIHPQKFIAFLKANREHMSAKGFFKINLMEGKNGNWYLKLDTFKPGPKFDKTPDPDKTYRSSLEGTVEYPEEIKPEEIPW